MNEGARELRIGLLRQYYKFAALGWFLPKSLHWAKFVTDDDYWRWVRADKGIRGRLMRDPPIHVYQTVLGLKTDGPPRGASTSGYLLSGPLLFDVDMIDKNQPFSLWSVVDAAPMVADLIDIMQDRGPYRVKRVMFSGFRGVHVAFEHEPPLPAEPILLTGHHSNGHLSFLRQMRKQVARTIGYWCGGWDWRVTSDIWRVSRVPWSIHGTSALRAMVFVPPFSSENLRRQMLQATPFTLLRNLRVRMTHSVPVFSFVDGETYGPYRRGWATRIPAAVALHLIWQDVARLRERLSATSGGLYASHWQTLFRESSSNRSMHAQYGEGA